MPWFKVDDGFGGHPKTRRAGLEAVGLWTVAGSESSSYLTEGFIDRDYVASWPRGLVLAKRLVRAGFWEEAERNGVEGWVFHDWPEYNPSREKVLAERASAKARQQRARSAPKQEGTNGHARHLSQR